MATGDHDWTAGEEVTAANMDDYLMLQVVQQFATSAARDTALSARKREGMVAHTADFDRLWGYNGTAWVFIQNVGTAGRSGVILTDAAQSFTSGAAADITWGTEVSDVDGWTSGGSATLTVPSGWDGRYLVSVTGQWSANAGTAAAIGAFINGTALYGAQYESAFLTNTLTFVRAFAATDTIKFQGFQNSGGVRDLVSRLEITWLER